MCWHCVHPLGSGLDALEHPSGHRRVAELHEERPEQTPRVRSYAQDQPSLAAWERLEQPGPGATRLFPEQPIVGLERLYLESVEVIHREFEAKHPIHVE